MQAGSSLAISLKNNNNKKNLSKPVIKKPISRKERAQQKRKEMIRAFYKSNSMGSYNTEKSTSSLKKKKNQTPTVGLEPTTTRLRALRSTN